MRTIHIGWTMIEVDGLQLWLAASGQGLCYVGLPNSSHEAMEKWVNKHYPGQPFVQHDDRFITIREQLAEYLAGDRQTFEISLDFRGTPFQISVWQTLQQIPYGEVWSYGQVAKALNHPKAVRAVGAANGQNPIPIVVPCHRVIGSNGTLTGFRGGLRLKERLLQVEGVHEYKSNGHARFAF
jgi:methylated-DNA-[protein]-cysteine S-methyltransferase